MSFLAPILGSAAGSIISGFFGGGSSSGSSQRLLQEEQAQFAANFALQTHQAMIDNTMGIPDGAHVYCTVYAGSQLIGSGSNAKIENGADGQPGFVCNAANHGNPITPSSGFIIPAFQAGLVYTIVYSVGK